MTSIASTPFIPELLIPAGSLDKLKVAINYGADAVYVGGQKFGLRTAADNFTHQELIEGVDYAHQRGRKVYVVLNGFLFDDDLEELATFAQFLSEIKVDAVIVSDIGVIEVVRTHTNLEIHLSTQASCLTIDAALFYASLGVKRIVLGREISILEAQSIKKNSGLEIELFIHGSMCMAYSGNCTISNFTQGRDSNRGGCAHSCRFEYTVDLSTEKSDLKSRDYFLSSKDLRGLALLEQFARAEIDSLKVEGRMKSPLYAAVMAKVYREAIDLYRMNKLTTEKILILQGELEKVSHRAYTEASLVSPADELSIFDEKEKDNIDDYRLMAQLESISSHGEILVMVRYTFHRGDTLELLPFKGENTSFQILAIKNCKGEEIEKTNPSTLVWLQLSVEDFKHLSAIVPGESAEGMVLRNSFLRSPIVETQELGFHL